MFSLKLFDILCSVFFCLISIFDYCWSILFIDLFCSLINIDDIDRWFLRWVPRVWNAACWWPAQKVRLLPRGHYDHRWPKGSQRQPRLLLSPARGFARQGVHRICTLKVSLQLALLAAWGKITMKELSSNILNMVFRFVFFCPILFFPEENDNEQYESATGEVSEPGEHLEILRGQPCGGVWGRLADHPRCHWDATKRGRCESCQDSKT